MTPPNGHTRRYAGDAARESEGISMKTAVLIPTFALALSAFSSAAVAMQTVPYTGTPGTSTFVPESNRLTTNPRAGDSNDNPFTFQPLYPSLGVMPYAAPPPRTREQRGPGFLNADPFDPNSVVNSADRNRYANPYPYDPVYNPYGQAPSNYAPRGGANVPMGNGIPYGR